MSNRDIDSVAGSIGAVAAAAAAHTATAHNSNLSTLKLDSNYYRKLVHHNPGSIGSCSLLRGCSRDF